MFVFFSASSANVHFFFPLEFLSNCRSSHSVFITLTTIISKSGRKLLQPSGVPMTVPPLAFIAIPYWSWSWPHSIPSSVKYISYDGEHRETVFKLQVASFHMFVQIIFVLICKSMFGVRDLSLSVLNSRSFTFQAWKKTSARCEKSQNREVLWDTESL